MKKSIKIILFLLLAVSLNAQSDLKNFNKNSILAIINGSEISIESLSLSEYANYSQSVEKQGTFSAIFTQEVSKLYDSFLDKKTFKEIKIKTEKGTFTLINVYFSGTSLSIYDEISFNASFTYESMIIDIKK